MKDYTKGYEPGGCFTALMGVGVAFGGIFLPWAAVSVLCGMLGAWLLLVAFMKGMNG